MLSTVLQLPIPLLSTKTKPFKKSNRNDRVVAEKSKKPRIELQDTLMDCLADSLGYCLPDDELRFGRKVAKECEKGRVLGSSFLVLGYSFVTGSGRLAHAKERRRKIRRLH